MKIFPSIIALFLSCSLFAQTDVKEYLEKNHLNLHNLNNLEIGNAKAIGYGALHGSAKTEEAEYILLKDLIAHHHLKYYFPETDFYTALYFQQYIDEGDESLLKDLIYTYGTRVPQEKAIEVFEKWKRLRPLFNEHNIKVLGADKISSYKYSLQEFLTITKPSSSWPLLDTLRSYYSNPNTDFISYYNTPLKDVIKQFIDDYDKDSSLVHQHLHDPEKASFIIWNWKRTIDQTSREETIYLNYKKLKQDGVVNKDLQFFRYGVFHIMKNRINGNSSFFRKLIENEEYSKTEIISIQAFLTQSAVLWDPVYFKDGRYKTFTTKKGYGIADYWLEYYQGIKHLKAIKRSSDLVLFYLNKANSPYSSAANFDLVAIKKLFGKSYWYPVANSSTIDYIDIAVLIRKSEANTPIEELKE